MAAGPGLFRDGACGRARAGDSSEPVGVTKFARYALSPTQPVTKFAQHGPSPTQPVTKFAQHGPSPTQPVTKFAQQVKSCGVV